MATYNPTATRAALKTLLETLTGSGQPIAYVYDYFKPKLDGYPAIVFDIDSEDSKMLDDANNMRVISFKIFVVVEIATGGIAAAKASLDTVTKSVVDLLEKRANAELSSTVDWTMPVMGQRQHTDSPDGAYFSQELVLKCNVASSIL